MDDFVKKIYEILHVSFYDGLRKKNGKSDNENCFWNFDLKKQNVELICKNYHKLVFRNKYLKRTTQHNKTNMKSKIITVISNCYIILIII